MNLKQTIMKKQSFYFLFLTLIGMMIYSCQNDDDFLEPQSKESFETEIDLTFGEKIILGKQLENPFSVENMRKAWININNSSQNLSRSSTEVAPATTHYYVKFIPKNSEELGIIEKDSSLIAYDYPLDYEILEMGDYYHDPEVPIEQPTYHYASVEIGKPLPRDIEYEILSDLFIPDIEEIGEELYDNLIDEALRLTNNLETDTTEKSLFSRRSKWRPAGTIKVWDANIGQTPTTTRVFSHWEYYDCGGNGDDILPIAQKTVQLEKIIKPIDDQCRRAVYRYITTITNGSYVPVEGVKVRARRWFTTHTGITNSQGRYSCNGRFRRPANYKIKWKRHDFSIRWSWLSSAKYNGPKKEGDWNLNIKGGTQEYYATVFRAAHHYYYKDIKGLNRPPQNSFWKTQLKINANTKDKENLGVHVSFWRAFGLYNAIGIYTYGESSRQTYATTIHELAHASHWNTEKSLFLNFNSIDSKVKESWARGVQWELSRMVYPDYLGGQRSTGDYTLVVSDIIDDDFITTQPNNNQGYYNDSRDQVSGYTIKQIEDALKGQKTWNNWRDNIINKYTNLTENNLIRLFRAYE
jgi:hypothetical protein